MTIPDFVKLSNLDFTAHVIDAISNWEKDSDAKRKYEPSKGMIVTKIKNGKVPFATRLDRLEIDDQEIFTLYLEFDDISLDFVEAVSQRHTIFNYNYFPLCQTLDARPLKLKELFYSKLDELNQKNLKESTKVSDDSEKEENYDNYFDHAQKEIELKAKFPGSGKVVQTHFGPIRTFTETEMRAHKRFGESINYIEIPIKKKEKTIEELEEIFFPELSKAKKDEEQIRQVVLDFGAKSQDLDILKISRLSRVKDDLFILKTIEKMIRNNEISNSLTKIKSNELRSNDQNKSEVEKTFSFIKVAPEINWKKSTKQCKNCGKVISHGLQAICEQCGEEL